MHRRAELEGFERNYREPGSARSFERNFTRGYDHVGIFPKNVVFFQHDLVTDHAFGEMHVIFRRNVLIYFGQGLRARALGFFRQGLVRRGFLCLGASKHLASGFEHAFEEHVRPERIYRRREEP